MRQIKHTHDAVLQLVEAVGPKIILATPLGVGKPNYFLNSLYQHVRENPHLNLTILTALTLHPPVGKSDLEKRFLEPMVERVFGSYPNLDYENDRMANKLPTNIEVIEFYFHAGKYLSNGPAQQNYLSSNYTHVVRDLVSRGVNCICQQVAPGEIEGEDVLSLSCNPDLTIDLAELCEKQNKPLYKLAQINPDLPFMYGESIVSPSFFDIVLNNPDEYFPVFAPPKMSVSDADYMIGVHASTLVKDNGEIQIGIGSLGDALVYALCLRQNQNDQYQAILTKLGINEKSFPILKDWGDTGFFEEGLFAATEMLVDSFSELYKCKILKKKVFDSVVLQRLLNDDEIEETFSDEILQKLIEARAIHADLTFADFQFLQEFGVLKESCSWQEGCLVLPGGDRVQPDLKNIEILQRIQNEALGTRLRNGAVAHGGFFLGPRSFYDFLKKLPVAERKLFRMKRISQINQLYGHEEIDRLQRTNGRFINTCMKVTLNGAACSDALENGGQVSGVGGQYNFVTMAHELPDARSILQLRSCRTNSRGQLESNILFHYGNCTIPRHLRDVVITEYGIADLRGKTDAEVACELIQVSDSRFQESLIDEAVKNRKLPTDFKLDPRFANNYPGTYTQVLQELKKKDLFAPFPFGTDLTTEEIQLGRALKKLKSLSRKRFDIILHICQALTEKGPTGDEKKLLERLQLSSPTTLKDKVFQRAITRALRQA